MTTSMKVAGSFAVCAVVSLSCTSLFGPDTANVLIQTDAVHYEASHVSGEGSYTRYGFSLVARTVNLGRSEIYLARCYPTSVVPVYGVELVDRSNSRGSAYSRAWACVGHDDQFRLGPGDSRTDTLTIAGPNAFDGRTGTPFGILEGRMRLRYELQSCRGDGACRVDGSAGRSNEFTVTLATDR